MKKKLTNKELKTKYMKVKNDRTFFLVMFLIWFIGCLLVGWVGYDETQELREQLLECQADEWLKCLEDLDIDYTEGYYTMVDNGTHVDIYNLKNGRNCLRSKDAFT